MSFSRNDQQQGLIWCNISALILKSGFETDGKKKIILIFF